MDYGEQEGPPEDSDAIIVKADEVDEAGADISTISPNDTSNESDFNARIEFRRAQDAQTGGSPKVLANAVPSPPRPIARPILRREYSAPAPPQQPPPPAPPQQREDTGNPTDSLSLLQLKRLVTDLPKIETTAYAYDYSETRSFPEELEEWFQYTEEDRYMLLRAKQTFIEKWEHFQAERPNLSDKALEWTGVEAEERDAFIQEALLALEDPELSLRAKSLECVSYVALGVWDDTAGVAMYDEGDGFTNDDWKWLDAQSNKPMFQLKWISSGVELLCKNGTPQKLINVLQKLWESEQDVDCLSEAQDDQLDDMRTLKQIELNQTLTALYLMVEVGRWQRLKNEKMTIRDAIDTLEPNLPLLLTRMIAKLRWEDSLELSYVPRHRLLLLLWKTLLLLFGDITEVENCKTALRKEADVADGENDENFITTSPLDYHLFRQEITSKYPAYNPPPPLVPIEPENNSILPPLPNHPSRQASQESIHSSITTDVHGGQSILHQPVHIATPAPSPPPSPGGPGGKGGKKQNYQTNQNFPFLYPPLDSTGNNIGVKNSAGLHDHLVGKRWDGGDVPASILEASQLFASRMRMSRSIRQLWDVREQYIKNERGWNYSTEVDQSLNLDRSATRSQDGMSPAESNHAKAMDSDEAKEENETEDEAAQKSLNAVKHYYYNALPDLQSLVIVLWKEVLPVVSALVTLNGQSGNQSFAQDDNANDAQGKRKTNPSSSANLNGMVNGQLAENEDGTEAAVESLGETRHREITAKAVSGILLVLLKWFKLSHILKFEYLTQLLLDANYLPLILKYFAHQDIDKSVEQKNDREDLNFFSFTCLHSKHSPASPPLQPPLSPSPSSSEDEAAPPPIRKHRRSPASESPPHSPPGPVVYPRQLTTAALGSKTATTAAPRPEVDELGYPTSGTLPQIPLTNYAPRFFLTNINLLRILQKISKRKAHRALLLVQYKSSTILRKALKIPQPSLRLYTLKLFKSQVPYCGRKWRQTNMRVITAIYLHCRPELRDEWLCGGDVDGVVDEAVPLEQAGRALVHWWHLRYFREVMEGKAIRESRRRIGGDGSGKQEEDDEEMGREWDRGKDEDGWEEEYNFFARELEKMGWGGVGGAAALGEEEEGGEGGLGVGNEFEGGPLEREGWT